MSHSFAEPLSELLFVRQTDPLPKRVVQSQAKCMKLDYHNGRTIQALTYQPIFLGQAWQSTLLSGYMTELSTALKTAMQSTVLNEVFQQYFNGATVTTTALAPERYQYIGTNGKADVAWKPYFYGRDAQRTIEFLHAENALPSDLETSAILLVLAPGTILFKRGAPSDESASTGFLDSMRGLASYHTYFDIGARGRVYYAVSVWSDGENGAALPAWQPWQSTCAGLYHELAEIRTNPNNEGDLPKQKVWGWSSCEGEEIGDLPVIWAGDDPSQVFVMKTANHPELDHIPIERLWSNDQDGPYTPP